MNRPQRIGLTLSIVLAALVSSAWLIKDTTNPVDFFTGSNSTPTLDLATNGTVTVGPTGSSATHAVNGALSTTGAVTVNGTLTANAGASVAATSGTSLLDIPNSGSTTSDISQLRLKTTNAAGGRTQIQYVTRNASTNFVQGVGTDANYYLVQNNTGDFSTGIQLQIGTNGTMIYGQGAIGNSAHQFFGPTYAGTPATGIISWHVNAGGGSGYTGFVGMDASGIKIGHDSAGRDIEFSEANTTYMTISSSGQVTIATASGGGNVPHACVTTSHTSGAGASSDSVSCGAGLKLMGGGCNTSGANLQQSSPTAANPPSTWNCSVATTTTITSYAICCVY